MTTEMKYEIHNGPNGKDVIPIGPAEDNTQRESLHDVATLIGKASHLYMTLDDDWPVLPEKFIKGIGGLAVAINDVFDLLENKIKEHVKEEMGN